MNALKKSMTGWNQRNDKWNSPSQVYRYIVGLDQNGEVLFKLPYGDQQELSEYWSNKIGNCTAVEYRYYQEGLEILAMREVMK